MNQHRRLIAWQKCHQLAGAVYDVTDRFPTEEMFGLTLQLRRAATSASANIAEGYARKGNADCKRFLGMALSSLAEVDALLALAERRAYVEPAEINELVNMQAEAGKTTMGLLKRLRR